MKRVNSFSPFFLHKRTLAIFAFVFLFASVLLIPLPIAHASITVDKTCTSFSASAVASVNCVLSTVPGGDTIIVVVLVPQGQHPNPTDNASGGTNIYNQQVQANCGTVNFCAGGPFRYSTMYTATPKNTHGLTVTINFSPNLAGGLLVLAVSNISPTPLATATSNCNTACSTSVTTTSSLTGTGNFAIAGIICGCESGTTQNVPGAGFTWLAEGVAAGGYTNGIEYSTTISGTTNFPMTTPATPNAFSEVGAVFSLNSVADCTHTATCSIVVPGVTVNSAVVLGIECGNNCQSAPTISDTLGLSFTQRVLASTCPLGPCAGNTTIFSSLYTAQSSTSGSDTITVTLTGGQALLSVQSYVIASTNAVPACTAAGQSAGATSLATSGSCTVPAGAFVFASLAGLAANTITAGASFTLTTSGAVNQGTQEATGISGVTLFPATISAATGVSDAGMVLFGLPNTGTSQTFTLGSCPTKNTATTTLANNTEYLWTTNTFSQEQVNTITAEVASVNSGHAASENLFFAYYLTAGTGGVSVANPLLLAGFKQFTLSATSTAQSVQWSVNAGIGLTNGATFAIALIGNSKILVNNSGLAGMFTATGTGNPVPLQVTITALTGTGTQLFFCAGLSYQSVVTSTVTSSTTVTTTSTTSVAAQANGAVLLNNNFMLAIIIILGPSLLMATLTRSLWGGILGASLGAAAGAFIGFVPFWVPVVIVVTCVTVLFFARGGGGDRM